ncbi:hypothetical protein C8T65DRAFT_737644 [Cerioporus squamosus]|nr:hypothetical protein C8T65DRAFT_737644 [Cerioporus squamosus]
MPPTVALRVAHRSSPLSHLLPDTPIPLVSALTVLDVEIKRPQYSIFAQYKTPCSMTMTGSEGQFSMAASYQRWSDDIRAQPPRSAVLREIVQRFAPSQTLAELTLRFEPGFVVVQADWDFVLEPFRSLTKFSVHIDACKRLVRTLCRPHICPHLETIAIHCSDVKGVHESVVSMAEYRVARGTPLRRFEFHQKPRVDPRDIPLAQTRPPSTPLSARRLARLRAFIQEGDTTPGLDHGDTDAPSIPPP